MAVLAMPRADAAVREASQRRILAMLPLVPRETAASWLQATFRDDAAMGQELLAEIALRVSASFQFREESTRMTALKLQHLAGTELLAARGDQLEEWSLGLEVLTRGWINEAQKSLGGKLRKMSADNDDQVSPLAEAFLLEVAPGRMWRQAVDADTADHLAHLVGLLAARQGDEPTAQEVIADAAARDGALARELAEALVLSVAGVSRDESRDDFDGLDPQFLRQLTPRQRQLYLQQMSHSHFWSSRSSRGGGDQLVLTRAGQLRNLARLSELLQTLRQAGVQPLDPDVLVQAFAASHSPAEVYRDEDIERVFGPANQLSPDAALPLAAAIRDNLATAWRDP
ncbi:MAG: hypothetical protein WEH44_02165, partial [Pirellulaceae bacterium]